MERATSGIIRHGEKIKIVLPFPDFGPRTRFTTQVYVVPEGKLLHIDEISLYVSLGDTHHTPPEKAIAYLGTGTVEDEDNGRMSVREPVGVLEWLDVSGPPWVGTTTGFLRATLRTFTEQGVRVTFVMKDEIELGKRAGGKPTSHAVVIGRLVDRIDAVPSTGPPE